MALINKTHYRSFVLDVARTSRAHKFTRVSREFIAGAELALREWTEDRIRKLPSVGKTIK